MVVNKEGEHNVSNDYSRNVSITIFFTIVASNLSYNDIMFLSFTIVYYLYVFMVVIIIYFICSNQSGEYQVKYMNVYIEPLIDELLKL